MIDRIKAFGEASKTLLIYVLAPLAFIIGYVYYLITKNKDLTEERDTAKFDTKHEDTKNEQAKDDSDAQSAIGAYTAVRDKYLGGDEP